MSGKTTMKHILPGATVKIAKGVPGYPNSNRYVGRTGVVEIAGKGRASLRRTRGRYLGIAGYEWPLSSLRLERTSKGTEGKKRG